MFGVKREGGKTSDGKWHYDRRKPMTGEADGMIGVMEGNKGRVRGTSF